MKTKIKIYSIYVLILFNLFLVFRYSHYQQKYKKITSEYDLIDKKINQLEERDKKDRPKKAYRSDQEFIDNILEMSGDSGIDNLNWTFDKFKRIDSRVSSEVNIEFISEKISMEKFLGKVNNNNNIDIESLDFKVLDDGNIDSTFNVRIESKFENAYRNKDDIYNKKPFRVLEYNTDEIVILGEKGEEELEVSEENDDNQGFNFMSLDNSIKPNTIKDTPIKRLPDVNSTETTKDKIDNYEIIDRINKDLHVFHFRDNGIQKNKKYITKDYHLGRFVGKQAKIDFWINSNIDNFKIMIETEDINGNIKSEKLLEDDVYKRYGWKYFNGLLELKDLENIRLYVDGLKAKGGTILIEDFSIREIN